MARRAVGLAAVSLGVVLGVSGCGYDEDAVPQTVLLPGEEVDVLWCYRTLGPPECFMEPQPGEASRLLVISDRDEGSVAF